MDIRAVTLLVASLSLVGCASVDVAPAPRQGTIPATSGGASGYQHGGRGSLFVLGEHVKRVSEYGYLKEVGDEGALAIKASNGSAFCIPNANVSSLESGPYGGSPEDHDRFVRDYFIRIGVPTEQIGRVRTMTLLEVSGRSDEATKPKPEIKAYYSVLQRAVYGISVPDSFAWARVNNAGRVVEEAVYWPALSGEVVSGARRLSEALSDPTRRSELVSRVPRGIGDGEVAIRHASAWVDSRFEAFPSFDVIVRSQPVRADVGSTYEKLDRSNDRASPSGTIIVRHFDADGVEFLLPQERRNIGQEGTQRKGDASE